PMNALRPAFEPLREESSEGPSAVCSQAALVSRVTSRPNFNRCSHLHQIPDEKHVAVAQGNAAIGPVLLIHDLPPIVRIIRQAVNHDHAAGIEPCRLGAGAVLAFGIGDAQGAKVVALGIAPIDVVDAFRRAAVALMELVADRLTSQLDRKLRYFLALGEEFQGAVALIYKDVVRFRSLGCERPLQYIVSLQVRRKNIAQRTLLDLLRLRFGWRRARKVRGSRSADEQIDGEAQDERQDPPDEHGKAISP